MTQEKIFQWTDEKEALLIDFYEGHQFLWDINNPDYFKKSLRELTWNKFANILDAKHLKAKFFSAKVKSLRTMFNKELSKVRQSRLRNDRHPYSSKWKHFNRLMFLMDNDRSEDNDKILDNSDDFCTIGPPCTGIIGGDGGGGGGCSSDLLDADYDNNTNDDNDDVQIQTIPSTASNSNNDHSQSDQHSHHHHNNNHHHHQLQLQQQQLPHHNHHHHHHHRSVFPPLTLKRSHSPTTTVAETSYSSLLPSTNSTSSDLFTRAMDILNASTTPAGAAAAAAAAMVQMSSSSSTPAPQPLTTTNTQTAATTIGNYCEESCDLFGKLIASKLRRLDFCQQDQAQIKILQVLSEISSQTNGISDNNRH